ncbi:MAG TPA: DUF2157 domain-containing protein [Thermoanaerobaculia bacterium]|nr:DUF2157 domain-containing protein [Thermoanaerobaculia bacterium]
MVRTMFSLAPEIERLRPLLGDARTDALLARERREIFSIYPELRVLAWGGVMLLVAAAGLVLKNNLERIGPLGLAILMAVAAAACYAWVARRRDRPSLVDDYVLLLGALLLSADVAFIETQFHILGDAWRQHLLLVAVLHGITAYVYRSRIVLSLAITSLAAWIGADQRAERPRDFALAAYITVAVLLVWRALDRRFAKTEFSRTIEHFAANLALLGSMALIDRDVTLGCLVTIAVAGAVIAWGIRSNSEWFVLYAFLYGVVAVNILLIDWVDSEVFAFFLVLVSTIGAIVALFRIHAVFRERNR